jgi:hypothetical protein
MTKSRLFLLALVVTVVFAVGAGVQYLLVKAARPGVGVLRVDSIPRAKVLLNGQEVGQTPYEGSDLAPGEYVLKLAPAGEISGAFAPWETKIKVVSNTLTFVSRDLAGTFDQTAGQTLTLEKLASDHYSEVAVISDPDGALITVDGKESGRTSQLFRNLDPGDHVITVSQTGFSDQVIHSRVIAGYRLNINVKLKGLSLESELSVRPTAELIASPSALTLQTIAKPYVTVKDNPVGFLRIRSGPDVSASESGKVYPGQKLPLLSESDTWVQIKFNQISGWVWKDYVDISK